MNHRNWWRYFILSWFAHCVAVVAALVALSLVASGNIDIATPIILVALVGVYISDAAYERYMQGLIE